MVCYDRESVIKCPVLMKDIKDKEPQKKLLVKIFRSKNDLQTSFLIT